MLDGCTIYRLLLVLTQRDVLYQKKKFIVVCIFRTSQGAGFTILEFALFNITQCVLDYFTA